jgi:hypothetical protein
MFRIFVILFILFNIASCATQRFELSSTPIKHEQKPIFQDNHTFFLGGVGQKQILDSSQLIKYCGSIANVAAVETKRSFLNNILSIITYSIYSPAQYSVYCK